MGEVGKKLVTKNLDVRNIFAGGHILSVGGDAIINTYIKNTYSCTYLNYTYMCIGVGFCMYVYMYVQLLC